MYRSDNWLKKDMVYATISFNPYFNGCIVLTAHIQAFNPGLKSFNPYFNGCIVLTTSATPVQIEGTCFNPYFNGCIVLTDFDPSGLDMVRDSFNPYFNGCIVLTATMI